LPIPVPVRYVSEKPVTGAFHQEREQLEEEQRGTPMVVVMNEGTAR